MYQRKNVAEGFFSGAYAWDEENVALKVHLTANVCFLEQKGYYMG